MAMGPKPRQTKERILSKIRVDENGCWIFDGAVMTGGYGGIWKNGKHEPAHREMYRLFCGEIEFEDDVICHKCDVRLCVNPEHLFKGKRADNNRDMREKRRHRFGETSPASKLSENDVTFIRSSSLSNRELADRFGITQPQISRIRSGTRWVHSFKG